jgi:hypothetical protein
MVYKTLWMSWRHVEFYMIFRGADLLSNADADAGHDGVMRGCSDGKPHTSYVLKTSASWHGCILIAP